MRVVLNSILYKQTKHKLKSNKMKTLINILGIIYITGLVLSIITLILIACKAF
jgi:hypothetical protein